MENLVDVAGLGNSIEFVISDPDDRETQNAWARTSFSGKEAQ
jgi:hypothetical protein